MKRRGLSIQIKLLLMVVVPLVLLYALLLVSSILKTRFMGRELFTEKLKEVAVSVNDSYNILAEGDWSVTDGVLCKGGVEVGSNLIDSIGRQNDIDITIFYGDTRYLTTLTDSKGQSLVGTKADSGVVSEVLKSGREYVSDKAFFRDTEYYAFYMPLVNSDGSIVGMLFVGEERQNITKYIRGINDGLFYNGIIICFVMSMLSLFMIKPIVSAIKTLSSEVDRFSNGELDISCRVSKINKNDELGILADSVNGLAAKFREILGEIKTQSGVLTSESEKLSVIVDTNAKSIESISQAVDDVAKGAEEQAQDMTNTMGNVQELSVTLDSVMERINNLSGVASSLAEKSCGTKDIMHELVEVNNQAKDSVQDMVVQVKTTVEAMAEIDIILENIENIASKTNLLSLNASIEAAKAGEAGKGFAVVASEIRRLAGDCTGALKQIAEIVKNITGQMGKSEELIEVLDVNTGKQLEKLDVANNSVAEIISGVAEVSDSAKVVNAELGGLDTVKAGIGAAVESLSAISQENAASSQVVASSISEFGNSVKELSGVAEDINSSSVSLRKSIKMFR